jgi:hypothetical protein
MKCNYLVRSRIEAAACRKVGPSIFVAVKANRGRGIRQPGNAEQDKQPDHEF